MKAFVDTGATTPGVLIVQGCEGYDFDVPPGWQKWVLEENIGLCGAMNLAFRKHPNEPWYGLLGDDIFPETPGWDLKLITEIGPNRFGNCHDGWSNEGKLCGIQVWGGELLRAVGWFAPEGLWHCYWDDIWEMIGTRTGCRVIVKDVKCRSPHAFNKTAEWDDTLTKAYERFAEDERIFNAWKASPEKDRTLSAVRNQDRKRSVVLSGNRVMICTPSLHGRLCDAYVASLVDSITTMHRLGIGYGVRVMSKQSILPYVRNRLMAEFRRTSATHLLYIDDDMGWPAEAIPELLAHDRDVIAAVGITKDEDPEKRRFCVDLDSSITKYDKERGIIRVKQVGTGFMLIKRDVVDRMWDHYDDKPVPAPVENPDLGPIHWVFDFDRGHPEGWGEDYTFCRRWQEIGGEVWVDPAIRLEHIGEFSYTGTFLDYLQDKFEREQGERAA